MRMKNARTKARLFMAPLIAEELEVRTLFSVATGTLSVIYAPSDGTTDTAPSTPGEGSTANTTALTGNVSETFVVALPAGTAQGEWVVDASTGDVLKQDPNGGAGAGLCTINVMGDSTGNLLMVVTPDKVSFVVMEDAAPVSAVSLPGSENTAMHSSVQVVAPSNGANIVANGGFRSVATNENETSDGQAMAAAFAAENMANVSVTSSSAESPAPENTSTSTHGVPVAAVLNTKAGDSQKVVDDPGMFEGEFTVLAKAPLPKREPGAPLDENDVYAALTEKGSPEKSAVQMTHATVPQTARADGTKDNAQVKTKQAGEPALALNATTVAPMPEAQPPENNGVMKQVTRLTKWWKAAAYLSLATGLYVRRNETMNRKND